MRYLLFFISVLVARTMCMAQTIVNPAFGRSDIPAFYIKKVEITKDTTYVFCQRKGGLVLMFHTLAKSRRQGWSIDIERGLL